jgi:hypothetical protein
MRHESFLLFGCCHVPYQNQILWGKVLRLARDMRPDNIVVLGDFGEFLSVSTHNRGSLGKLRNVTLEWEYEQMNAALDQLDAALPRGCRKHFVEGNHEDRYWRWCDDGDNAKIGRMAMSPPVQLRMEKRGYTYLYDWQRARVRIGKHLEAMHDGPCSANPSKTALDDQEEGCYIFPHTHRFGCWVTGKRGAYNIGGLFDKKNKVFGYAKEKSIRHWVNALASVVVPDDGSFIPNLMQCWNNRFVWGSKLY